MAKKGNFGTILAGLQACVLTAQTKTIERDWHWTSIFAIHFLNASFYSNLVPRACDPREGTRGSGIIRCRMPGILAKIELRIPFQRPIRFLPETDYPSASRSFPRIAGSGNEIGFYFIYRGYYTEARGYEYYFRVVKTIFRTLFLTRENNLFISNSSLRVMFFLLYGQK